MQKLRSQDSGFTVLELMISTVVFSVLLIGAATMLVQIGRLFYKGVVSSRTQEVTRNITDDISRTLQFGGETPRVPANDLSTPAVDESALKVSTPKGDVTINAFCIGSTRYSYIIDGQVNSSGSYGLYDPTNHQNYVPHGLWRDEYAPGSVDCSPLNILDASAVQVSIETSKGREMLGEGMRLYSFGVPTQNGSLSTLEVGVAYGQDDEILDFTDFDNGIPNVRCTGVGLGSQWCATSKLKTTVFRRIN